MLSTVDLILLVCTLLFFLLLGYYFRNSTSTKDYFLAGQSMSVLPVALSISVSLVSSASMTLFIGEVYLYGLPIYQSIILVFVLPPLINRFVLPVFYNSDYLSVYQYLEKRFSRSLRIINSVIFLLAGILNVSTIIYSVSIAAEVLADVPFWISVLMVGTLSTTYSALGGMKAVIWTDVFQCILMVVFYVLIIAKALLSVGSVEKFWNIGVAGRRIELNLHESQLHRYGLVSNLSNSLVTLTFFMCMCQPAVQRWKCVPTIEKSKRTVLIAFILNATFSLLTFISGVALYVFYSGCDVLTNKEVNSADKISSYFIRTQLSVYPGLVGLCLAGLLSGALSSVSSFVNSFAAVTLEDFVKTLWPNPIKNKQVLTLCKLITVFYGILCTASVFVIAQSKIVFIIRFVSSAAFSGPTLGLLFLGLWCKTAKGKGVSLGLLLSVALVLWMSIGSFRLGLKHETLPLDVSQCTNHNVSYVPRITNSTSDFQLHQTFSNKTVKGVQNVILESIYGISFAWYSLIGLLSSLIFGFTFSLCFGIFSKMYTRSQEFMQVSQADNELMETKF